MGEIGDMSAGSLKTRRILIDQGIHLLDERANLLRLVARYAVNLSGANVGQ